MNEQRLEQLLKRALAEQPSPSFEELLQSVRQSSEEEAVPQRLPQIRHKAVRRFVCACCLVVLASICCATFARGGVNYASASYPMSKLEDADFLYSTESIALEAAPGTAKSELQNNGGNAMVDGAENSAEKGAILFNILQVEPSTQATTPNGMPLESRAVGNDFYSAADGNGDLLANNWLGAGLSRAITQQGDAAIYDVVAHFLEEEQTEFSKQLQVNSLLTLPNNNYYLRMDVTQISECAAHQIKLSLVGAGKPARPEYFPENVDDKAAWIATKLKAGETTKVRYQLILPPPNGVSLREYAQQNLEAAFRESGLTGPTSVNYYIQEQQTVLSAHASLTCAQIIRLAGYNMEDSTISSEVQGLGSNDAEIDYYYLTNGDGWVFS